MRFVSFERDGKAGLALETGDGQLNGLLENHSDYPGDIVSIIAGGTDALSRAADLLGGGDAFSPGDVTFLPPIPAPGKILCIGLNYASHAAEAGFERPEHPSVFARYNSSLVAHGAPLVRPAVSRQFDYEGEMVAVIGKPGRHITRAAALEHVAGYAIFNDASVRDFQLKYPQWTIGKNFDGSGGFGPAFVTADELPAGGKGLRLTTRLNGRVMQDASTDDLIFDVPSLIAAISEAMRLEPGDIIVTGTPEGIGYARDPKVFLQDGDVCEVEVEGIGVLRNPVVNEEASV